MDVQINVKVQSGLKQTLESGHQRVGTGTTPVPGVKQNLTVSKCIDPGVYYNIRKTLLRARVSLVAMSAPTTQGSQ